MTDYVAMTEAYGEVIRPNGANVSFALDYAIKFNGLPGSVFQISLKVLIAALTLSLCAFSKWPAGLQVKCNPHYLGLDCQCNNPR